mmetsp:Transcript_10435/g.29016  ORF Transcript_10435/g.29016 Transcript_10435/m.29016 type:complete len:399 (-) Transcript_10435:38-1234(-)
MSPVANNYTSGYAHGCCAGCIATAVTAILWVQHGVLPAVVLITVAVPFLTVLGFWILRPVVRKDAAPPPAPAAAGERAWPDGYGDPLRWTFLPSSGVQYANVPRPYEREDELCSLKALVMHQPTHEPWRSQTGQFPFSWHLAGRRRLWEIRLQVRFKRLPEGPLYVGIENGGPAPASGLERRMNELLIGTVRKTVGKMYASPGDDPMSTEGELEPATMAVPLGAFDQFAVSDPGEEPDIASDLSDVGMRRTDGLKAYLQAIRAEEARLSTEKVYTFCFWGVSQFLDCINWQARMGFHVDFNRFCGQPPWFFAMYELPVLDSEDLSDQRHLLSRKRYYIHVAIWSELRPPEHGLLARLLEDGPLASRPGEPPSRARRRCDRGLPELLARCACCPSTRCC